MSPTLQNNSIWQQKKSFQPTICSHLYLSFFGFERTFYYVLNWHFLMFWTIYQKLATQQQLSERISLLLLLRQYKRSVFKSFSRNFWTRHWRAFLPQMIAKHLLKSEKMPVEQTTETILWRQISDLSGQFSDHSSQMSVQTTNMYVTWANIPKEIIKLFVGRL
jgi:hypothetical protein